MNNESTYSKGKNHEKDFEFIIFYFAQATDFQGITEEIFGNARVRAGYKKFTSSEVCWLCLKLKKILEEQTGFTKEITVGYNGKEELEISNDGGNMIIMPSRNGG